MFSFQKGGGGPCPNLLTLFPQCINCIYKITSHNATTMPIMRHNWHWQCQLCDIQCRICCINGIVAQLALQLHNWHCGCTIGIVVAQLALWLHNWHCEHNWHCLNCTIGIVRLAQLALSHKGHCLTCTIGIVA